jgi:hypothetical protein
MAWMSRARTIVYEFQSSVGVLIMPRVESIKLYADKCIPYTSFGWCVVERVGCVMFRIKQGSYVCVYLGW